MFNQLEESKVDNETVRDISTIMICRTMMAGSLDSTEVKVDPELRPLMVREDMRKVEIGSGNLQ